MEEILPFPLDIQHGIYDSFFIGVKTKDLLSAYPMGKVARLISRKIDNGLEL